MRLAVDARELAGHPTGVGRYLAEVLRAWHDTSVRQRHDVTLFTHTAPAGLPSGWAEAVRVVPGDGGSRWEQWDFARALRAHRPDVLFAPGYTAPLACPASVVLAVHDVSFFAHPEWFTWREGLRRRLLTAWSAQRARLVLAPSAFSAQEIVRHTGAAAERVRLVPLGVRLPEAPPRDARAPLVLFVGSLFQRRRIDVLIDAFARVAAEQPLARLEIVGANRTRPLVDFAAQIRARGLDARVRLRDFVDDATLEQLYAEAAAFVFLSQYEGFGFTPLEAMARGAVPVVLDTPVAREVYGAAAIHVPASRTLTGDVARAIMAVLQDGDTRVRLQQAAGPLLRHYRWADTAARTLAALEEAARD